MLMSYDGPQQPARLRSQPLQLGPNHGGHLQDRQRVPAPNEEYSFAAVHYPHQPAAVGLQQLAQQQQRVLERVEADGRMRVAADQHAHGWSASRGRYVLSQEEQRAFAAQQQPPPHAHAYAYAVEHQRPLMAPQVFNGMEQRASLRAQPVGGRLQYGPDCGGHLEERWRDQGAPPLVQDSRYDSSHVHYPHQPQTQQQQHWQQQVSLAGSRSQPPPSPLGGPQGRFTTEQVLREQQRQERQEAEDRRNRAQEQKRRDEEAHKAEKREHQDAYEQMLQKRREQDMNVSPARAYELARHEEHAELQTQQLDRQRALAARTAHLSPVEQKEARIVDWIRGGNPWAEQGFVPMSETQGNREYVSSRQPGSASGLAAARLQRSEGRMPSHRGATQLVRPQNQQVAQVLDYTKGR